MSFGEFSSRSNFDRAVVRETRESCLSDSETDSAPRESHRFAGLGAAVHSNAIRAAVPMRSSS